MGRVEPGKLWWEIKTERRWAPVLKGLKTQRRKAHLEDSEGPQKVLEQRRETGVNKAVFRLTALHPFRFGTFLRRPPRTQVRILWGWDGSWGVHGASGLGEGVGGRHLLNAYQTGLSRGSPKGDTSGK